MRSSLAGDSIRGMEISVKMRVLAAAILSLGIFAPAILYAGTMDNKGSAFTNSEGQKVTCSAGFDATRYTPATDVFAIIGSSNKTVRITSIVVTGTATANSPADVLLVKRSTANSGGTPTEITPTNYDSSDPACTASVVKYAAAPTLGALIGVVRDTKMTLNAPGAAAMYPLVWDFGTRNQRALVLRGANELAALNWQGAATPAGMDLSVTIEWTEE